MLIQEIELRKLVEGSKGINVYPLNAAVCFRGDRPVYPDYIKEIIDKLESLSAESVVSDIRWSEDEDRQKMDAIVVGLADLFFGGSDRDWEFFTSLTLIFEEGFAVELGLSGDFPLHGEPTNTMTLDAFALKEGKTLEDLQDYLPVIEKLFKL